jgi:hypothetical protein
MASKLKTERYFGGVAGDRFYKKKKNTYSTMHSYFIMNYNYLS